MNVKWNFTKIEDSYPLSPMQQGMLFHSLHAPQSGVDIEQLICALHEDLNVKAFKRSWQRVVERHPVLRTSFCWEGVNEPLQEVHRHVTLPIVEQDWRGVPKSQQEKQLEAYLQADRQRGFELTEAPLMRLALFRVGETEYQFIWTFHHALLDGRSFPLVLKELFAFYEAFCQGEELQLELPHPYRDYIDWLGKQDFIKAQSFWRQTLKGFSAPTPLVFDRAYPTKSDEESGYGKQGIRLSFTLTKALQSLAQQHQLTLNTLVQGAWALLLARYSGEADVVFGATRACRRSVKGAESMVGLFINTVPVRVRVEPERLLIPWLKELRAAWVAIRDYEHTPLVKIQGWSDIPSGKPLFESILVFENYRLNSTLRSLGGSWENRELRLLEKTNYPLGVAAYVEPELLLEIAYARCRFNDTTIARMLGHLRTLLEGMVAHPEQRLLDLSLLTAAERHQLLVEWNNTQADYPLDKCIHQLFEAQVKRTPEAIAVVFKEERLTYFELNCRANQVAHYLRALGVGPDVLVGICMERSLLMVIGLLGILKAGGAYVPLDPTYPQERLAFMLADAQVLVLLTQSQLKAGLPEHQASVVCLDADWELSQQSQEQPASGVTADNLAYVIYTSGSTGRPKGVLVAHRGLCNLAKAQIQAFDVQPTSCVLQFASFSFDASISEVFMSLCAGATLCLGSQDSLLPGPDLIKLLRDQAITTITLPPSALATLPLTELPTLRTIIVAGEACAAELVALWAADRRFCNAYGPTEATVCTTVAECDGKKKPPIGRPIANTQVYILDADLQPVPVGISGELYIGGDGLARGYLNRPELTAQKFIPNPFSDKPGARLYKTGDLARYLPDGNIEYLGRIDDQVKLRGYRIELGEIEAALQHKSVRQTVVLAREDIPGDKRLVAYVVSDQSLSPSKSELRRLLQEQLPEYMVPSAFVMLDALPLLPNGKVDRKALPNPEGLRPELETAYVIPRTEVEQTIAAVWQEVLHVEKVGIHDNFFELGGHSLLMPQVHNKLRVIDRDISIIELFKHPTISSLAKYLSPESNEQPDFQKIHHRVKKQKDAIEGIAIIGMSGRFPGAKNIDEFWQNLRNGVESVSFFTEQELEHLGVEPAVLSDPHYVKAKAALEDVELFDASFFGFNPREAEITDPQHRLFLECAWSALESAGYNSETYSGSISVYGGASDGINTYLLNNLYSNRNLRESVGDYQISLANNKDFLTTRVSYKLNLKGQSATVQTACSTSLVAISLACQSLRNYQCDMAIAGGVSIMLPQKAGYLYQEGMIFSPDGHCRAFDAKAQGTVIGSGVGIVVLKRLKDALADGDYIHAVIKGSAINNDGSLKVGYTAPSVDGQAQVIAEALAMAEVEPETVTYIEAHGTGTPLGDPIEIAALTQAFSLQTQKQGFCAIGSVKTNVGHLDTAAGVTGLIKTVLALKHKLLPPSLHFEAPNPKIDFANSPFYVNAKLCEWKVGRTPLRAGVSSFGIGGTNAHVVLEEAPIVENSGESRPQQLLVLSAKTSSALDSATANLVEHLKQHPDLNLADVAYTLQVGRRAFGYRRILVCQTIDDAAIALLKLDPKQVLTCFEESREKRVVFMFPGQGAQYVNMALELYQVESVFREQVDLCCELLLPHLGLDLRQVLYPQNSAQVEAATEQLQQTAITQPALFVIEYALAKLWMQWGVRPQAMIGHSIGEYVAAFFAGVFSLEDALALVAARGRLIQQLPTGSMLAVWLSELEVQPLLGKQLSLAAINGPSLCVVSGSTNAVAQLEGKLSQQGVKCRRLDTSHAFHSEMMEPILEPFTEQVKKVNLKPPKIPYVSNVTGTWITAKEATAVNYWIRHLREEVRFDAGLHELLKEPQRVLLEVGPGRTLSTLARQHPDKGTQQVVLSSVRCHHDPHSDVAFLLNTLGQLWLAGIQVDWSEFYAQQQRHRLPLPTYPFERQRYWVEPQKQAVAVNTGTVSLGKPDVKDWFYIPEWKKSPLRQLRQAKLREQKLCWLVFIDGCGLGDLIVKRLELEGQDVISVMVGEQFSKLSSRGYKINPLKRDDYDTLLCELKALDLIPKTIAHFWNVTPNENTQSSIDLFESQSLGFSSLLFLAQALGKQNTTDSVQIAVVSNNMQQVTGSEVSCPQKATVLGPCKVIPQEYPHITCRSIDVVIPESGTQKQQILIDQLLAELTAKTSDNVVAYRKDERRVQTFKSVQLDRAVSGTTRLRQGGVYLITGGLGGIGLVLAEYLASTRQAKLILVGRKALPDKDEWSQWLATHDDQDDSSRKIRKVQALEDLGAEVLIANADVANQQQMQAVITQAKQQFGVIHGVIHAAGIAGGGVIQLKTPEIAASVLAPKVKGTLVLDLVLKDIKLDFLALSSSITSIVGEFGQVDYCAANTFLDAFAHYNLARRGTFTVSINWDAWREVGMAVNTAVPRELKQRRVGSLEKGISSQDGVDAFSRILGNTLPQVVVSTQDLLTRIEHAFTASSAIEDLEKSLLPKQTYSRPELKNAYVAPRNDIEQTIANIWQELLAIGQVGIHDNFFELGGDSLIAVSLFAQIKKIFGLDLALATLFQAATVEQQANLLHQSEWSAPWSSLVPIQPLGSKPPLFCVHGMGGNVLSYSDLPHYLGSQQPVYGLQAQGLDGKQPAHTRVEDMASYYIKEIRTIQPDGPYLLAGYSLGGMVAFEMAQQLHAQGQKVAMLALFDTFAPPTHKLLPVHVRVFRHLANLLRLEWKEKLTYLKKRNLALRFYSRHRHTTDRPAHEQAFIDANSNYVAQVYPGRAILFRASEQPEDWLESTQWRIIDRQLGWGSLVAGGLELHEIPGHHMNMFSFPHVRVLAEKLQACLDQAQADN